jgi:hypothetical protein
MKRILMLLAACLLAQAAAAQHSSADSLSHLFDMVRQLQAQQAKMAGLAQRRSADSLKIADLEAQLSLLAQGQQAGDEAQRMAREQQEAISQVQARQAADAQTLRQLQDSLRASQQRLAEAAAQLQFYQTQMASMEAKQQEFSAVQLRIKLADEITYRHIRDNLANTALLYEMMNDEVNDLYAFRQLGTYQQLLQELNNPSSDLLGFSYNDKVMELMEQYLLKTKKPRDREAIVRFARKLLENPIVQGITSVTPVLNTASSLLSFISGVALDGDIPDDQFDLFREELQRYTRYYAKLNEVNAQFEGNLSNFQNSIQSLHTQLMELSLQNARQMSLKTKDIQEKERIGSYLLELYRQYNKSAVESYFATLEKQHRLPDGSIDYAGILKLPEVQAMYKRTENAMLLFRDFENLHNLYLHLVDDNTMAVIDILIEARDNKLGKTNKVKAQIDRLGNEMENTVGSVKTAINLPKLARVAEKLSKYPPAI